MKFILAFLFTILLGASARAQGSGIGWPVNPASQNVNNYHVWDHIGINFILLATVPNPAPPATQATWYPTTFAGGSTHLLSVSAINTAGVEGQRSADLTFPLPATPPTPVIIP